MVTDSSEQLHITQVHNIETSHSVWQNGQNQGEKQRSHDANMQTPSSLFDQHIEAGMDNTPTKPHHSSLLLYAGLVLVVGSTSLRAEISACYT